MSRIYVLDDEKNLTDSLCVALSDAGYEVSGFYSPDTFLKRLSLEEPDLAIIDIKLPGMSGLDILKEIKNTNRDIQVIIVTSHGDISSAISATKLGAHDFITKPFDLDEMLINVSKCMEESKKDEEIRHLRGKAFKMSELDKIMGVSDKILSLKNKIKMVSKYDSTVLITGESGTGKELIAKAIHNESERRNQRFIDINCSGVPQNLLESELFGYEKGAFTDAKSKKTGLIELAHKGTLFLDEIGDMPLELQPKLLRFLENRKFRQLGGRQEISVDVRIVAATNRNLKQMVEEGIFRNDLYYRLNIIPIDVPPLRERKDDIPVLCENFLKNYSVKFAKGGLAFDEETLSLMSSYDWPGNVRELKNIIERIALLCTGNVIKSDMLPFEINTLVASDKDSVLETKLRDYEKRLIDNALKSAGGIKSRAAEILGISRFSLMRRMRKLFGERYE